jgi:hypothetical protein
LLQQQRLLWPHVAQLTTLQPTVKLKLLKLLLTTQWKALTAKLWLTKAQKRLRTLLKALRLLAKLPAKPLLKSQKTELTLLLLLRMQLTPWAMLLKKAATA